MTGRLRCPNPACGNREEFLCGRTSLTRTLLDGEGRIFAQEARGHSDAGFDVTCARCATVVVAARTPLGPRADLPAPSYERWLTAVVEGLFAGALSAEAIDAREAEGIVLAVLAPAGPEGARDLPSYAACGSGVRWETEGRMRRLLVALYGPFTQHTVHADAGEAGEAGGGFGTVLVVDARRASGDYPGRLVRRVRVDLESLGGFARDARGLRELYEKARSFGDLGDVAWASAA